MKERAAVLTVSGVLGAGLAVLVYWTLGTTPGPLGPLATTLGAGGVTFLFMMGVALAAGVTRIIMPCGLPVLMASAVTIRGQRVPSPWLTHSLVFLLGGCIAMGIGGAVLGALGGSLLGFAGSEMNRMMLARWLYTGVAGAALVIGLYELGFVRLMVPVRNPFSARSPVVSARLPALGDHFRCAATGSLVTAGFGIACPLPTTTIAMVYVASTGDVLQGVVVGVLFGLGMSLPVIAVAYLLHRGVEMTGVARAIWGRITLVRHISGGAIILFSIFTLVFWTILLGL